MSRHDPARRDTIFALSSGRPPAAIAVLRISGPDAEAGLRKLATLPFPRRATMATLRHPASGEVLDEALVLWMPGPKSATGEDVVELHTHGGRAVVDAVLGALSTLAGHRPAKAGEFTRRAFENGRIDLNEAEGLADLLAAETDGQRRAALLTAGGVFSRQVEAWRGRLLGIAASAEAAIDYSEEIADDVPIGFSVATMARQLASEIDMVLTNPPAERLKDGIRVVFAGPPNVGKSTLINALAGRDAAIVSPVAGTTRDVIEVPLVIEGLPLVLIDTAGLRDGGEAIEAEGILRATREARFADLLVWLGSGPPPVHENVILVSPQADHWPSNPGRLSVSAKSGSGLDGLRTEIVERAHTLLPREGVVALNVRQRDLAYELRRSLTTASNMTDSVIQAEHLRAALATCDRLVGRSGVEDMLDTLFGAFCLGK